MGDKRFSATSSIATARPILRIIGRGGGGALVTAEQLTSLLLVYANLVAFLKLPTVAGARSLRAEARDVVKSIRAATRSREWIAQLRDGALEEEINRFANFATSFSGYWGDYWDLEVVQGLMMRDRVECLLKASSMGLPLPPADPGRLGVLREADRKLAEALTNMSFLVGRGDADKLPWFRQYIEPLPGALAGLDYWWWKAFLSLNDEDVARLGEMARLGEEPDHEALQ